MNKYLILILCVFNFLGLVWMMLVLNDGFSFTNRNIDNSVTKNEVLVQKADEVIGKYKRMMQDIESEK